MKLINIKSFFAVFALAFAVMSCDSEPENMMSSAQEGGDWLKLDYSDGKVLGSPQADGSVVFTDVELNFEARAHRSNGTVTKYTVKKELTRGGSQLGVSTLGETASLDNPFKVEYTSITEFIEGMDGVNESDLQIGDVFNFFVEMTLTDGRVVTASANQSQFDGTFALTVQCGSALAGTYTRTRDNLEIIIEEVAPGEYIHTAVGNWGYGNSFFTGPMGGARMVFNDVCGDLQVPDQQLNLGQYSNEVSLTSESSVDPNTGVITLNYTIGFSAGPVEYVDELVPIN
ncbi:hypothetical protein KMW28_19960 [Flammeovirga yaeyamensis]|uniref:Lipoprotein n=1 Tax=Flammeovirga yaeyamensis TaxID=367791 RepID=A0AAX1N6K3_9BACT|nr:MULTISPECIES: hypothetical protein [Flammeovirga]ANQ50708.1 hypothetical protein MY04_3346 [Flammeovirga sp. MY04]MBB3701060.1 hypothetical protein [Flammeovirga yaeyamensis]NMF38109.1 hypothetical protein [Flammeovirga yaeyamensis]QWG01880.1 hypothetical protein KMW28_19960 [Flammeovirga yaeyamensis]